MIDSTSTYPTSGKYLGHYPGCLNVFYSLSLLISIHSGIVFNFYPGSMRSLSVSSLLFSLLILSHLSDRHLCSYNGESSMFDQCKEGDVVMIEIDIRSSTPSERTMHLFINGTQQKPYAINLPPSICFIANLYQQNVYMTFVEYQRVSNPKHTHIDGEASVSMQ